MPSALLSKAQERLSQIASVPVAIQVARKGPLYGSQKPKIILHIPEEKSLLLLVNNQLDDLAAAYVTGQIDIEGTQRDLMELTASIVREAGTQAKLPIWQKLLRSAVSALHHTREKDQAQIGFHYDVSDEFYELWLDPRRVYSCAYYRAPDSTLAQAQNDKLDHICRKLDLKAGERFLDIGAGWGGLLLWAAENYGVKATGITLSKNQHAHVNRLIKERGLSDRVEMRLCDYRDLDVAQPFDKIASVGMFEHVGRANLPVYFQKLQSLLKPGGLLLNHGITSSFSNETPVAGGLGNFIERFIFPGGELFHVSYVLSDMARHSDLEITDVEGLRPHYARTLWDWSDNLEARLDEALAVLSKGRTPEQAQQVLRAYRIYLSGCAMAFEQNWVGLYQILAARPNGNVDMGTIRGAQSAYPFSRDYIYKGKV